MDICNHDNYWNLLVLLNSKLNRNNLTPKCVKSIKLIINNFRKSKFLKSIKFNHNKPNLIRCLISNKLKFTKLKLRACLKSNHNQT